MDTSNRLLQKSREVNEVWLRSWGCQVRHHGFCSSVTHPSVSEFNALYDIRSPEDIDSVLDLAIRMADRSGLRPTVLLPDRAEFTDAVQKLVWQGYHLRTRNETIVVETSFAAGLETEAASMQSVTEDTLQAWIGLYRANSGSRKESAITDEVRWGAAFRGEPRVHFYFLDLSTRNRGTVQLVEANNGCCGIFSLTIPVAVRQLRLLRLVSKSVFRAAVQLGCDYATFDRVRPASRRRPTRGLLTLRRNGLCWHIVSTESGYIPGKQPSTS